MKSLFLSIRKADLFGKLYGFEEKENQKFTTVVGNIATLFVIIVCFIIGFMFGQEVYKRITPTVIVSEENLDTSRVYFHEYPIMISFALTDGSAIYNSTMVMDVLVAKLDLNLNLTTSVELSWGLTKCNPDDYAEKYRGLIKKTLKDNENAGKSRMEIFCPNTSLYAQNGYITVNSTFINLIFIKCNPKVKECHPDLEKLTKDLYINMYTFDPFVDPKNYTNPVVLFQTITTQQVSDSLMKRTYINVEKAKLVTHKGWLLEDVIEDEFFSLKDIVRDVNPVNNGRMYSLTISSPTRRKITMRKYMKVQDLLASIGGFFNFLYLFSYIILSNYIDFSYYFSVLSIVKQEDSIEKLNIKPLNLLIRNETLKEFQKEKKLPVFPKNNMLNDSNAKELIKPEEPNVEPLKNNFISQNVKTQKVIIDLSVNQLKNQASFVDINSNIKSPQLGSLDFVGNNLDNITVESLSEFNYLYYLWNDIICCRSTTKYFLKMSRSLLSFHNIIELNTKEYINKIVNKNKPKELN